MGAARSRATAVSAHAVGLVTGAGAVFGALGALGAVVSPGRAGLVAAAAVCAVAAVADARGRRLRLQIPFQVPERWRRAMPLPLALFLYGLLLGAGFATAVPAAATWAVACVAFASGNAATGLAVGAAFAAGRIVPLAMRSDTAFAERPAALRAVRVAAAVALVATVAAALATSAPAATVRGFDPSAAGDDVVWTVPGASGFLQRRGQPPTELPGTHPSVGGDLIAWRSGSMVTVARRATLQPLFREPIKWIRQLAISNEWLVLRVVRPDGLTKLIAQSTLNTNVHRTIAAARPPDVLGRPSVSASTVVYPLISRGRSAIMTVEATGGRPREVRGATDAQLLAPSLAGRTLVYVESSRCAQRLLLGGLNGGTGRELLKRAATAAADEGRQNGYSRQGERTPCGPNFRAGGTVLWSTALAVDRVYVTEFAATGSDAATPSLLRIPR